MGLNVKQKAFLTQFFIVSVATLNTISDGMNYGWSSPMLPRLKKPDSPIKITEADEPWLESIVLLAGLLSLPIAIYLVDKIGRKQSTWITACSCVIGWFLIAIANNVIYLYIARFTMGVAANMAYVSNPMYISEISHKSIRGYLSAIMYLMSICGTVLMYAIGPHVDFYVPSIVAMGFLLAQMLILPFMPDSPYFLVKTGKTKEAKRSLKKLRATDDVEDELNEIISFIEHEDQQEKGKVTELFTVPSVRRVIITLTVLNAGQHFDGYTPISMNLNTILQFANSKYFDEQTSTIVFGCLMLLGTIGATILMDKFGRKTLLILSTATSAVALMAIGIYFHFQVYNNVDSVSWIPVTALMFFAVTYKIGLGVVPIVLTGELFPDRVKAYGMAFADGLYVLFGSLSVWIYDLLRKEAGGMYTPFYFFTAFSFITCFYVCLFVPETKGKSLEEVQKILRAK